MGCIQSKIITFATMVHLENKNEWFANWFDSPYYHLLYDNRDENEAANFLERLTNHLAIPTSTRILDLACGAGRHSRVLHRLGFTVSGCDLSPNSIQEATEKAQDDMQFFVHDMRETLPQQYDAVFNLFTSFGYFDQLSDNLKVLNSIHKALPLNGLLVIDFMNATKVIHELKLRQELIKQGITFHIKREVNNGRIVKTIAFEAEGQSYFFQEKVQALRLSDFQELLQQAGFEIQTTYGSYDLDSFNEQTSDRLILICRTK